MINAEDVTAIILAGGKGTRLRSTVSDRQKVVAEINGKPFLVLLLRQLEIAGISHAIICTGHMSDTVTEALSAYHGNIKISYSHEEEALGTGGAIANAQNHVNTPYLLAMNGDSFFDIELSRMMSEYTRGVMIALHHQMDSSRYGAVVIDSSGTVLKFKEKDSSVGAGLINAGIYLLDRNILMKWKDQKNFSMEKDVFPRLIYEVSLYGCIFDGLFIDIGTPQSYALAKELLSVC